MAKRTIPPTVQAWRSVLTVHSLVVPRLDAEMKAETGHDLQTYDALLHTFEAGKEGIRMSALADKVVLTRAGLTSLVDRLEGRGLLQRVPDPDDRRATRIVLTAEGEAAFREAAGIHVRGIEAHFGAHLTTQAATEVVAALAPVLDANDG